MVFSGEWPRHSTGLVTPIYAERIAAVPGAVLIFDDKAFAPTSSRDDSAASLFYEREEDDKPASLASRDDFGSMIATERWQSRSQGQDWEIDFSQTYLLARFQSRWGPCASLRRRQRAVRFEKEVKLRISRVASYDARYCRRADCRVGQDWLGNVLETLNSVAR